VTMNSKAIGADFTYAWEDAKNASDFSIFAPHLEKMIALTKEMAGYTDPGKEGKY